MDFTTQKFLEYLKTGKAFAEQYPFLDTAIFTLFQNIEDGIAVQKKNIYRIKHYFFFLYAFQKYYSFKNLIKPINIPIYKDVKLVLVINSPGSQHYGDSILIVENLIERDKKILIIYGNISDNQEKYLKTLNNVLLLKHEEKIYKTGIIEFTKNIFHVTFILKALFNCVKGSSELTELFSKNKGFLLDQFFVNLSHYNYSKKIIKNNFFKVIFSTNDGNYLARSYFINANRYGIENIITQHGFSSFVQTKTIANKVILWLKSDVNYYLQNKFSEERILPLGLPRFDKIREENITKENNLSLLFNINNQVKKICFAFPLHAYNQDIRYYKTYMDEINNVALHLQGRKIKVFIRAHPNDDIEKFQKYLAKGLTSEILIPHTSFPLVQLLKQMDIFIADFSTSIIESMLCSIPTLVINFDNHWDKNYPTHNFDSLKGCKMVTDKKKLLSIIESLLVDKKYCADLIQMQTTFIEENILNLGCATPQISDYLLRIL